MSVYAPVEPPPPRAVAVAPAAPPAAPPKQTPLIPKKPGLTPIHIMAAGLATCTASCVAAVVLRRRSFALSRA